MKQEIKIPVSDLTKFIEEERRSNFITRDQERILDKIEREITRLDDLETFKSLSHEKAK